MNKSPHLPLTHALGWIVASMLFINGISYMCLKMYLRMRQDKDKDADMFVRSIIQTGPQKEALKTEYLAEVLGICADYPKSISSLNLEQLNQKMRDSPLISHADIKLIKPNILYIDYTVRQPLVFLADFENVVIDREGYPFPFVPFFSPKNLPEIYIGLSAFGAPCEELDKPLVQWGYSLKGKYLDLALELLSYITDPKVSDFFDAKRIDVSQAFSHNCGRREMILITQDTLFLKKESGEKKYILSRILRLSTKNYAQELGNYLKLRGQLLEEERRKLLSENNFSEKLPVMIIDFRIPNLAFIEENK